MHLYRYLFSHGTFYAVGLNDVCQYHFGLFDGRHKESNLWTHKGFLSPNSAQTEHRSHLQYASLSLKRTDDFTSGHFLQRDSVNRLGLGQRCITLFDKKNSHASLLGWFHKLLLAVLLRICPTVSHRRPSKATSSIYQNDHICHIALTCTLLQAFSPRPANCLEQRGLTL